MSADVIPIQQRALEFRSYMAGWLDSGAVLVETVAGRFKGGSDPLSIAAHRDLQTARALIDKVALDLSPILRAPDQSKAGVAAALLSRTENEGAA